MMRSNKDNQTLKIAIDATLSGTTAGTPTAVDRIGFNSVTFHVFTGTVTDAGTATGITWVLSESDDNSSYSAVADADLDGLEADLAITLDTSDNAVIGKLGYIGSKRYLKLTPTGTTGTDAAVKAVAILDMPNTAPVA